MRFFVIFCVLVFLVNHDGRTKVLPLCPDWVLCAHPAFLRCRSGLSGSLSRVDLQFSVTRLCHGGRRKCHRNRWVRHWKDWSPQAICNLSWIIRNTTEGGRKRCVRVLGVEVCMCVCVEIVVSVLCLVLVLVCVVGVVCVRTYVRARVRVGATHERSCSVRACVVLRVRPYRS